MTTDKEFTTPILIVFFNRPDTLKSVIESLKIVKPKYLYVAQDGPRVGNQEDVRNCLECRKVLSSSINWDCKIIELYQDKNLGCKIGVSTAITWFFDNVEEGIILEDDCVAHYSFFNYAEYMLDKYRDNDDIGMICGSNVTSHIGSPIENDIYFSKMPLVWGWASWRRTWRNYQVDIPSWPRSRYLLSFLEDSILLQNWISIFNRVYLGKIKTWDYQLNYMLWQNSQLCVIPKYNLITNIGFDDRATHTKTKPEFLDEISKDGFSPNCNWNLPSDVIVRRDLDNLFLKNQIDPNVSYIKNILQSVLVYFKSL